MKNPLKPGSYMKVDSVCEFVLHNMPSHFESLSPLQIYPGEYSTYFLVSDLKNIFSDFYFRELEVGVTTHVILSDEDLQSLYPNF